MSAVFDVCQHHRHLQQPLRAADQVAVVLNECAAAAAAAAAAASAAAAAAAAAAGVDIRKTKAVAEGLGARDFRERPFFPDPYSVLNHSWSMAVESVSPTLGDEQVQATHRQLQIN